jgi:2-C-methyl-D-erythritol 2,4-cyclodiphosphate synthase
MSQRENNADSSLITHHSSLRIGLGYDIHRLTAGRKLMLGGVEIEFELGLLGHSDGDSLSHAICDALLGAAGLGDIGTHFSDEDPRYAGISSLTLLARVRALLKARGLRLVNLDATILAERPKMAPHLAAMRAHLAAALGVAESQINLKAKTNEGLDAVGRGEAIAAQAIALIAAAA